VEDENFRRPEQPGVGTTPAPKALRNPARPPDMNTLIHDQIAFHNLCELNPAPGGGLYCHRFPSALREGAGISPLGQFMTRMAAKCEMRFKSTRQCRIFLSSTEDVRLSLYRGDLLVDTFDLQAHQIKGVLAQIPGIESAVDHELYPARFPRDLWRICCPNAELIYHGIDAMGGRIEPPDPSELPSIRWLAYGSSITMAKRTWHGYVEVAAEELGWDSFNLGMAGSCQMESEIADWIASRDDWSVATFELGINMIGEFGPQEFERRARYLLETCLEARENTRILLIDLVRCSADARQEPDLGAQHAQSYREILDRLARELARGNRLHRLQGLDWVKDYSGFRADLVHPDEPAYFRMGLRLAERLGEMMRLSAVF